MTNACIFIDACVAFAEILGENSDIMDTFKLSIQRKKIPCYISLSAIGECTKKIDFTHIFFEKVFRTFSEGYFKYSRQRQRKSPISPLVKDDFGIFEDLFNQLRKSTGAVLQKPLRELEKKMVFELERILRKKIKIDICSFLNIFTSQALTLSANLRIQKVKYLQKQLGFFKIDKTSPDAAITGKLLTNVNASPRYPFHEDDANNISAAWSYKKATGTNVVFATFDFRTVNSHAEEIFNLIGLQCANPLYAPYYV